MEVVERGLQDERDLREQQSVNSSLAALGAEVLFALALSSVALWLILRGIDQREMLLLEMARPAILMQTVLDHAQAAVSLIDLDGRVIFVNKESARILGILPDAAVGRLLAEFMPSKEATSIMADNTRVHASGSVWTTEMTFAGADGSRVYLSRKMPMPASGDRPPTVCSITTDITSFRAHERSLLDANAELDAFSYSVAHDLRARLKAIDGFANSLQKEHAGTLAGEPLRLVSHVRADVEHMSRLIDALLSFSRIGRLALRDENVDMAGLARRAIADVAEAEQGNNVRLEIGDVPACHGDAAMLALVWSNLVSNAYKFTRPRVPACIKIGGALRQDAIEYWIKDDGVGFDPNHVGNLFSAFSRLHEGTKFEGTGIGLALVRRIVERHGGGVSAEGSVNGGAVFRFTLQRRKIT
jgi:PAS domain S-box-containing protein